MDVEKTIEFLVAQQAQFHANLEAQQTQTTALSAQIKDLTTSTEKQYTSVVVRMVHLAKLAQNHEERLNQVGERLDLVGGKVDKLGERVDSLSDTVGKLHEAVALRFKIVDDVVRRGNGSHPA
jgi:methyl-accepting chemotaxis protein